MNPDGSASSVTMGSMTHNLAATRTGAGGMEDHNMVPSRLPRVLHVTLFLIGVWFVTFPAQAQYAGGTGEPDDPYLISAARHLNAIGADPNDWDKHFKLIADIDLDGLQTRGRGINLNVIGTFTGVFDGTGHTISHFRWSSPLFGHVRGPAEIRDLGLIDPEVNVDGWFVGSLVGELLQGATVLNCSSTGGSVTGTMFVGGLVGSNTWGKVVDCHSSTTVSGSSRVGGLVGDNHGGDVVGCHSTGAVAGASPGGLVGHNSGRVIRCYSTGRVTGDTEADYLYSGYDVGGLVARNEGFVTHCFSTSTVTGESAVGGLIGLNTNRGYVAHCHSAGAVSGNRNVGGLVGGNSYGKIATSYSTGTVDGGESVGGLVGKNDEGTITSSFWDTDASGLLTSDGGTGKTTTEMQTASTFLEAGWDFVDELSNGTCDRWEISPGDYPRLRYHAGDSPVMPEGLGTAEKPYLIRDVRDLGTVWFNPMAHYHLEASVDLSGIMWSMAVVPVFEGTFDGNGHVISNLHIQGSGYVGLFGELRPAAEIYNLGVEDVHVEGIGSYDYVGGLVGYNVGDLSAIHSTGTVSGKGQTGGLAGGNYGSITASYSAVTISGEHKVGGLAGVNSGSITASYGTATVNGEDWVGGIAGTNTGSVTTSFSTGTVKGNGAVGGLVGANEGSITVSYNTGSVGGDHLVGGLVGQNTDNIATSYSAGAVKGNGSVGGLVGENNEGSITSSFWDIEGSGLATSDGGAGKTTTEMQTANTFLEAGWDFVDEVGNGTCDRWEISPGDYPRLRYHAGDSPVMPEGMGTAEKPYLIRDARDLGTVWFKPLAHYRLEASVDLSGIAWSTAVVPVFEGTFDGNGYVVSNLHIQGGGYLGLFGRLHGGGISNLGMEAVDVNGTNDHVGSLVGYNQGSVAKSYSTGTVMGNDEVGGLIGYSGNALTQCHSAVTVDGNECVGGLAGSFRLGDISDCYSSGVVNGRHSSVGGLVGYNFSGFVTRCCSTSTVSGGNHVAGLIGFNHAGHINTSYSTGVAAGSDNVGGLVGFNYGGDIIASYSSVAVCGNECLGGLVGLSNEGYIVRSYSNGAIQGNGAVGGLVGEKNEGSITSSFWDTQTSGFLTSDGGAGKTTSQMQTAVTFLEAGWDFIDETENGTKDIWWILEGQDYPRLWWELTPQN